MKLGTLSRQYVVSKHRKRFSNQTQYGRLVPPGGHKSDYMAISVMQAETRVNKVFSEIAHRDSVKLGTL